MNNALKLIVIASLSLLATGCASTIDELKTAGKPPALTPIQDPQMDAAGRRQVVLPMPQAADNRTSSNSLWRAGSKQFFADPRASRVGDILTVNVTINDNAQMNNTTTGKESSTKSGGVSNFFGLETIPGKILPAGYDPKNMIGTSSAGAFSGSGVVNRTEKMSLTVAALVTQILPNGNLVVAGRQEVRVNNEVRELLVSGIVRPQDISSANTVLHTQIAEARISYGGRGQLSKYNKQPIGQQVLETLSPF